MFTVGFNVKKGVYGITTEGRKGLLEYPELEKYYTELLQENTENGSPLWAVQTVDKLSGTRKTLFFYIYNLIYSYNK